MVIGNSEEPLPSPQSPVPSDALSLSKCPQSPIPNSSHFLE
ncbi:MAG: hypothetical protein ACKO9I_06135 [Sphaerospermopsis kisseleviana]